MLSYLLILPVFQQVVIGLIHPTNFIPYNFHPLQQILEDSLGLPVVLLLNGEVPPHFARVARFWSQSKTIFSIVPNNKPLGSKFFIHLPSISYPIPVQALWVPHNLLSHTSWLIPAYYPPNCGTFIFFQWHDSSPLQTNYTFLSIQTADNRVAILHKHFMLH